RIRLFDRESEAQEYAEAYAPYTSIYALTLRNALPMRDEPESGARRVYRLREEQVVKVLDRQEEPSNLSGLEGYWYKVLTEDGVVGYAFDYYLRVYDAARGGASLNERERELPELVRQFFNNTWYPHTYIEMIEDERIDLERFRPDNTLEADYDQQQIVLDTDQYQETFEFTNIVNIGYNKYFFEGAGLEITFWPDMTLTLQYSGEEGEVRESFTRIIEDIDEIITREWERREALLERIVSRSSSLLSNAYGKITIQMDRSFRWFGYERLVPRIMPTDAGETGTVEFSHFLGEQVQSEYEGVISFNFADLPESQLISFLFTVTDNGVQLSYVPPRNIEEKVVTRESLTPVIIFFNFVDE
ncbi:MAG: SH3 domain-containing protein, partial [Spirochaetia bacterium]